LQAGCQGTPPTTVLGRVAVEITGHVWALLSRLMDSARSRPRLVFGSSALAVVLFAVLIRPLSLDHEMNDAPIKLAPNPVEIPQQPHTTVADAGRRQTPSAERGTELVPTPEKPVTKEQSAVESGVTAKRTRAACVAWALGKMSVSCAKADAIFLI
jgi:hypothetical protein